MNALGLLFKDKISYNPNFRDLRSLQDDKTVLKNPHKGWYWHYIDNGYNRENYRGQHDPNDHLLDFPGLNHLYLRFDWGDIEKSEGVRDWSYIDQIFEKWGNLGYHFSFRICTYEASGENGLGFATPEWVFKAGAKYKVFNGAYEPDYGDRIFLEKLSAFMKEFGKRYNGHPLVESVDIGTFGTWGEGHTAAGSDAVWPVDVMKAHIDMHVKNFPDTFVLFNDDIINHRNQCDNDENIRLMDYAVQLGTGLRDDSVCVSYYCKHCGYDSVRTPFMFDHFWKQAPTDIEFEHYETVIAHPEYFRDGFPFLQALERTHATYAGFHGYPRPWLEKYPEFTKYCANRLGYWYFIEGMQLPELASGTANYITFSFTNRGFAPCYYRYDINVKLVNQETGAEYIVPLTDVDNTAWMPGQQADIRTKLDCRNVPAGEYDFAVGMFEQNNPIKLGIQSECCMGGYYRLTSVSVK